AAVLQNYLKWRQKYLESPHRFREGTAETRHYVDRALKTETFFMTWRCEQMSGAAVQSILARAKRKLGVKKLHAHLFRHTYATEKALDREPFPMVMRWMGHKSTEMTEYYFRPGRRRAGDHPAAALDPGRRGDLPQEGCHTSARCATLRVAG